MIDFPSLPLIGRALRKALKEAWLLRRSGKKSSRSGRSGRSAVMKVVVYNYLYSSVLDMFMYYVLFKKSRITYMVSG